VYDAIVVGAGPAGGMAARQLAHAGLRTLVLDKKRVVGEPVQCAEGVSRFGLESNGVRVEREWVMQEVRGARCVVPCGRSFAITDEPGYAIDRARFDRWVLDGALSEGAELRASSRVTQVTREDGRWRVHVGAETFETSAVVAADGPTSSVARGLGLLRRHESILAYEYRFLRKDVEVPDPNRFHLFIGRRYAGGYAWIFPKGDAVNVGVGGHIDAHAVAVAFCAEHGIDPADRVATIAGTIPYRFELTTFALPGLTIAGDAAGVTNPMNGAGIHSGLFSGRLAGRALVRAHEEGDPDAALEYDRALRASTFLDPLLFWMIERYRTWDDRLLDAVGEELDGGDWHDVGLSKALSAAVRRPRLVAHSLDFVRMRRALALCEKYGW